MKKSELVSSKDNPSIKLYRKLSESKKTRKDRGLFVLEGARLCFDSAVIDKIEILFLTESAQKKFAEQISHFSGRIMNISDGLGQWLCDTVNTQGVFAICKMLDNTGINDFIESGKKYAVLNSLQDPSNVGTVIRTADALGIDGVILCNCCDLYNPKVIRGTMGSIFRIKIIESTFPETIPALKSKGIISYAAVVDKSAKSLTDCDFSGGVAAVIGNEGNGLSQDDIALCDDKFTIKMHGSIESFNAATAATIILWEMSK